MRKQGQHDDAVAFPGLKQEQILDFRELDGFWNDWVRLRLDDRDLQVLQNHIMLSPGDAPVIKGTGGLRKLRFRPPGWTTGKSGAARVCFVHFPEQSTVLFVQVYLKSSKDDLTAAERTAFKGVIERIRKQLAKKAKSRRGTSGT